MIQALTAVDLRVGLDNLFSDSSFPKNAEAIVFGYFDRLAAFRTKNNDDDNEARPAAPVLAAPANGQLAREGGWRSKTSRKCGTLRLWLVGDIGEVSSATRACEDVLRRSSRCA